MKLCVALDLPTKPECLALAQSLRGLDVWLKVGLRSYLRDGADFVAQLQRLGFAVFLDLKLYDIPKTTADAAQVAADLGVDMVSIHASCGADGMRAVMERLAGYARRPLVMAITALTSFDAASFAAVYNAPLGEAAEKFAAAAAGAGLDGVVSSVFESRALKVAARRVRGGGDFGGVGGAAGGDFAGGAGAECGENNNSTGLPRAASRARNDGAGANLPNLNLPAAAQTAPAQTHAPQIAPQTAAPREFLTLCPGIRPFGEGANDQKRVADLDDARREGCDFIVIGRPIYTAPEPREVVERILAHAAFDGGAV